jgi:cytochrome bd-type quinol oxidase subunit 1
MVHSGTALFTLLGFMGIDFVIGVVFLWLISSEIAAGPVPAAHAPRAEVAGG